MPANARRPPVPADAVNKSCRLLYQKIPWMYRKRTPV